MSGDGAPSRQPDPSSADDNELEALGTLVAARFVEQLREERARQPGRSVLFPKVGDAAVRRQVVRWFGHEYGETTPGILEVLRTALGDSDWEVRVSAMLVAARLRATSLRPVVKEVLLPAAHQFGLSETDVRLLIALRAVATEALDADAAADRASAVSERFSGIPRTLVHRVLERDALPRTDVELFIHALVVPNEIEHPLPDPLPRGIARRDRRLFLGEAVELVWVSPTTHLLGDESAGGIRAHVPGKGFFIARRPVTAATLTRVGVAAPAFDPATSPSIAKRTALTPDPPLPMSHADALAVCEALTRHLNAEIRLPTADELECAARGTDGRRYSWGNGVERLTGSERTPHGLERFAVPAPQWTSTPDPHGTPLALGGPTAPMCAMRIAWNEAAAVRPIVRVA
jgi:formylglycine-generating enzyme required for sulfatase activity